MIQLGDTYQKRVSEPLFEGHKRSTSTKLFNGTVVYVHPERRYFVVQFDFPHGSYRESFRERVR